MHNGSEHSHTHVHAQSQNQEEAAVLLGYLLDHNCHHAEELHNLAHEIESYGKTEAASLLHACVKEFEGANDKLKQALELLKEA